MVLIFERGIMDTTKKSRSKNSLAIIVPCYNCANTINRCLNSIGNHSNIRVIVVNDCSNDDTLSVLESYKKNNPDLNITIINNEWNKGPGGSRNAGLTVVEEEYLMFLDADDFLDQDYYEQLNIAINESVYDCMIFSTMRKCLNREYSFEMFLSDKVQFGEMGKEAIALIKGCPWGKVFRTSVIQNNGITFADLPRSEDLVFTKTALAFCKKIVYMDMKMYWYVDNPGSIMNTKGKVDVSIPEKAFNLINEKLQDKNLLCELNSIFFFEVLYEGTMTCIANGMNLKECYKYFHEKNLLYSRDDKYFDLYGNKYKLFYLLAKLRMLWIPKLLSR